MLSLLGKQLAILEGFIATSKSPFFSNSSCTTPFLYQAILYLNDNIKTLYQEILTHGGLGWNIYLHEKIITIGDCHVEKLMDYGF